MNTNIIYSVSILCGGMSTRMGEDKALLDWSGTPLAMHIASGFRSCSDIFLSVRDESQYSFLQLPKAADQVSGCGPLAGLCASLQKSRNEILFVTTCDAPLVDKKTSDILTAALNDHDCVIPCSEDRIHPLIAVYRKTILPKALSNLNMRKLRIRELLEDLDVLYFPCRDLPFGSDTLANLNCPEDIRQFTRRSDQLFAHALQKDQEKQSPDTNQYSRKLR